MKIIKIALTAVAFIAAATAQAQAVLGPAGSSGRAPVTSVGFTADGRNVYSDGSIAEAKPGEYLYSSTGMVRSGGISETSWQRMKNGQDPWNDGTKYVWDDKAQLYVKDPNSKFTPIASLANPNGAGSDASAQAKAVAEAQAYRSQVTTVGSTPVTKAPIPASSSRASAVAATNNTMTFTAPTKPAAVAPAQAIGGPAYTTRIGPTGETVYFFTGPNGENVTFTQ